MKKRLLSAALALAMVLTLLPVSAFAATVSGVTSVSYYTLGQTITMAGQKVTISSAGWYETNTNTAVTNGVVASSGNSGKWFDTIANAMGANQTYIKLLGDATDSGTLWVSRSTTVDVNGHSASNVDWKFANGNHTLTLCDSSVTAATSAVKSAGKTVSATKSGSITVNVNDVSVGSIALDGVGDPGTNVNYAQKVTLNGGQVTNTVDLDGSNSTLTLNPSTKGTSVVTTITGAVTMDGASGLALNAMTTGTRGVFSFGSAVTMTQTNAGGVANFGSQTGSGTVIGKFTLTSPSGGKVTAYNTTFTGGAELTGYSTYFSATSCNIQSALAVGGVNAPSTLTEAQKGSLAAPDVKIVGGNVVEVGPPLNWDEQLTKGYTVSVSGNARVGTTGFKNAKITVTSSDIGNVTLNNGELTLAGNGGDAGNVTLGGTGFGAVTMKVTGTDITTGVIDVAANNEHTVSVEIPASDTNYFARLGDTTDGTIENGSALVKGGGFGNAVKVDYLDNSLQFQVENTNTGVKAKYVYYGNTATDMNNLVAAYQKAADKTKFVVTPVYDASTGNAASFKLVDGKDSTGKDNVVLEIGFKDGKAQTFTLPTWVNNRQVGVWTLEADENIQRNGGATYMTSGDATFNAQEGNYSLTKLTNVAVKTSGNLNPGVTAILSGNTIKLSGNVTEKGTATIPLILTTDNGDKVEISVGWNGTVTNFSSKPNPDVLNVVDNGLALQVVNGSVKYTLDGSGLRRQVEKLNIGTGEIVTSVATSVPGTVLFREQLGKDMSSTAAASFDFSDSNAVSEAFGRAIAGITDANIVSWRTSAQNTAWRNDGNTGTPTEEQRQATGYYDVYIVPYLNVNVTSIDNSGLMTATMEPYYRIEVRATGKDPIVVQAGRTMGVLSGEMGEVDVVLPVQDAFQTGFSTAGYAHQNATYAYDVTGAAAAAPASANLSFAITHAANSGSGFGTIVINKVAPLIDLKDKDDNSRGTYDALQAAVDDAENTDKIIVDAAYKGNRTINVTGVARTFKVDAKGPDGIKVSNTSDTVSWQNDGGLYTVQLLRDNNVKPTEKSVTISTVAATNGSAGLSASKANPGETITVTTSPKAGYGTSGLTIRTNTGSTVAYTSTATNRYTFKVPEGVTSITVTPAFAVNGDVAINVASAANGSASTNATGGKVKGGTTVTVTTRPNSGYATAGVTAVTNTGSSVSVSRIAENTYTFVAPTNATSVTVTPSFTASAHPFIDVAPSHWANNAVGFVYRNGLMKGAGSSVIFAGTTNISRADLVLILYRLSGEPYSSTYSKFNDVAPTAYYAAAVNWASTNNIVTGGTGNNFYPKTDISRQDLASILYRYNNYRRGSSSGSSSLAGFVDSGLVSSYAVAPMQWAVGNGVVNGSGNSLMPRGTASRYEAAQMLMNYCQRFLNMR